MQYWLISLQTIGLRVEFFTNTPRKCNIDGFHYRRLTYGGHLVEFFTNTHRKCNIGRFHYRRLAYGGHLVDFLQALIENEILMDFITDDWPTGAT